MEKTKFCRKCGAEFQSAKEDELCLTCQNPETEETESSQPASQTPQMPKGSSEKKKILVIDDEPDFLQVVSYRLKAHDYEVMTATDGQIGYEKIKREKPDLIISDLLMPHMTGYDLLKQLKNERDGVEKTPVIIVTSKPHMKSYFSESAIHTFMDKNFEPEKLISKIQELISIAESMGREDS